MQVFYPLPVTPHYVRLKKNIKQEIKTFCEKNKKELEELEIKEQSTEKDRSSHSRRKVSIWKIPQTTGASKSTQTDIFESLFDAEFVTVEQRQTVSLFDISETKQRKLEQEKFIKLFVSCSKCLATRSCALNIDGLFPFLHDIICQFKQVDVKDASGRVLKDDILHDTFIQTILCKREKDNKQNRYKNNFPKYTDTAVIDGDRRWLKLMSWWKMVNGSLEKSCCKLHKCLISSTELKSKNDEIIELTRDLQSFLIKTKLFRSTAELSAIKTYVSFDDTLPDIEMWPLSKESELSGFQEHFHQSVWEDSSWVGFLKECSQYALNLLSVAVKFLRENEKHSDKSLKIKTAVKNGTEAFFLSVIQPLLEANDEISVSTDALVEASSECLENFIDQVDSYEDLHGQLGFETAVLVVSKTLMAQMKLTIKSFQGLFYTSEMHISKHQLSRYLKRTILEGIVLAKMSMSKDLLSHDLLQNLVVNKDHTTYRSIKFASILLACNKVMHAKKELLFRLPYGYIQYDFEAFLDDTLQRMNRTRMDVVLMDASLKLRVLEEELTQKLTKSFKRLDKRVNAANILLGKAKNFQSKQTFC